MLITTPVLKSGQYSVIPRATLSQFQSGLDTVWFPSAQMVTPKVAVRCAGPQRSQDVVVHQRAPPDTGVRLLRETPRKTVGGLAV